VTATAPTVEHKDVVLSLLGVSAGLSGLVLVFLGFVVSTYQSFERPTPKNVLSRYRNAAALVLAAFAIGVACVALATAWLLGLGHSQALYVAMVWVFGAQVVALVVATGWTVWQLVWRS
jgi:vacuolar-type H+-ATPase subunit I/STV1